jgi:hypothetical protein
MIKQSTDKRVVFDFEIDFLNGGSLQGQDFRLDIDGERSPTGTWGMRWCAICTC